MSRPWHAATTITTQRHFTDTDQACPDPLGPATHLFLPTPPRPPLLVSRLSAGTFAPRRPQRVAVAVERKDDDRLETGTLVTEGRRAARSRSGQILTLKPPSSSLIRCWKRPSTLPMPPPRCACRPEAYAFALTQMARATGDRERDLDRELRERIAGRLAGGPHGECAARVVREPLALEAREQARLLDEDVLYLLGDGESPGRLVCAPRLEADGQADEMTCAHLEGWSSIGAIGATRVCRPRRQRPGVRHHRRPGARMAPAPSTPWARRSPGGLRSRGLQGTKGAEGGNSCPVRSSVCDPGTSLTRAAFTTPVSEPSVGARRTAGRCTAHSPLRLHLEELYTSGTALAGQPDTVRPPRFGLNARRAAGVTDTAMLSASDLIDPPGS
jgi:DNA-K related protein